MLTYRALQIDIYLLTYLLTYQSAAQITVHRMH